MPVPRGDRSLPGLAKRHAARQRLAGSTKSQSRFASVVQACPPLPPIQASAASATTTSLGRALTHDMSSLEELAEFEQKRASVQGSDDQGQRHSKEDDY